MRKLIPFRRLTLCAGLMLSIAAWAGIYDDTLVAANGNDTAKVIELIERGMDVNTVDQSGSTLLMIAARNGNEPLLEFLLRNRANIRKLNKFGDSALMLAAFRGHTGIVRQLLAAGAEIDNPGWNALHYAAFNNRIDVLHLLLERHAPLDAKAPNGQTALMLAATAGHLAAVQALVDADADMDLEDAEGRTALMLAEKNGHADVAAYLREEGAE